MEERPRSYLTRGVRALSKRLRYLGEALSSLPIYFAQNRRLLSAPPAKVVSLFVIPSANISNGGILSIFSLHRESRTILQEREGSSFLCTAPSEIPLILKNTKFDNEELIYGLKPLIGRYRTAETLYLHVPEYMAAKFKGEKILSLLRREGVLKRLVLNIMNQNILAMPNPDVVKELATLYPQMTITTAHHTYCTKEVREKFGLPLHHFSTWLDPKNFPFTGWRDKEELLVVSPDPSPGKESFLRRVKERYPSMRIRVIRDMSYGEYKEIIAKAKWSITFGEGLDGYFIEPIFCGALSFAIYNDDFFTEEFSAIPNVFPTGEALFEQFSQLVDSCGEESYSALNKINYQLLEKLYSADTYRANIRNYYDARFDFP